MSTVQQPEIRRSEEKKEQLLFSPRFDIVEMPDEVTLYGDLPGVFAEDLEIKFEDGELHVHGKVAPRSAGKLLRHEYGVGDFYRTFSVGESIDPEKISAELKAGVVTIHLPKAESLKPRRIEIKSA